MSMKTKAYQYNNQGVVTLNHIKRNANVNSYKLFNNNVNKLQLNKDFFVLPKKEAQKIAPRYNSPNAIFLTREGCKKLLYSLVGNKNSKVTKHIADSYINRAFGVVKTVKVPKNPVKTESMASLFDFDKSLTQMSTDNPLIQLIINKAATMVADRIIERLSA